MISIVEKLKEDNSISDNEVEKLVESAKKRLQEGESPVDVLCTYKGTMSTEEILKILPDER